MPRPDRFYWPSLEELAFTIVNPSVQTFRQAISIDERRCMFRLKKWDAPQTYKHNRFNDAHAEPQDILQVWFAGVHADIGGGYPEKQSGLSKYPLLWMIDEATKCGLQVNQATVNQLAWGIQRKGSPYSYVVPDVRGDLHTSLKGAWWILEYLAEERELQGMAGAQSPFRLLHPRRRTALHSRRRHHPRIRRAAHGRDAELPAGEFAEAVREVSDAGAAGACERGGGGSVGRCVQSARWAAALPTLSAWRHREQMATREELLEHLWKQVINGVMRDDGLDNIVKHCKRNPDGPFGDTGAAIERLLAAGASRHDLRLVLRTIAYEAVFGTLFAFSDPGLEEDDVSSLYEELLMADPSGMEGRPGSADAV